MAPSLPAVIPSPRGMTVKGSSAALLADLLVYFEAELRKQNAHIDQFLRQPAAPTLVEETFAKIGLKAPAEVVVLFGWHDGCVATGEGETALPAHSAGTADWQTEYQLVSLCTPVTWWIDCMRRGWYRYDRSTHSWNRSNTGTPQKIRMYRMS